MICKFSMKLLLALAISSMLEAAEKDYSELTKTIGLFYYSP